MFSCSTRIKILNELEIIIKPFLAPTGAQGEAMSCVHPSVCLCVRPRMRPCVCACIHDIIEKDIENEF